MTDLAILGQVVLGYSPFIERNRAVTATRLTVFPLRPDAVLDATQLLDTVVSVWPVTGGRVLLNVISESLLHDLMRAPLPANVMLEVPSFMVADPANQEALRARHEEGSTLLIKSWPLHDLPSRVLLWFKYSIIDVTEDWRVADFAPAAGVTRSLGHVQSGVRTIAGMEEAFARGVHAVLGWPIDDAVLASTASTASGGKHVVAPGMEVIVELMRRVDMEEPIAKLEATLKRDPPLAFKLLRYINAPAFGLRVEINSFQHAIMMLGYKRLKRWLALLLATAGKDAKLKPVMFAALRRGLLMEELARSGGDEEMRGEIFICGVFSLLDHMFQQPFEQLLNSLPVPERVRQALVDNTGPYQPYIDVVRAVETGSLFDFREAADKLMMSAAEINRALLRALTAASELE